MSGHICRGAGVNCYGCLRPGADAQCRMDEDGAIKGVFYPKGSVVYFHKACLVKVED